MTLIRDGWRTMLQRKIQFLVLMTAISNPGWSQSFDNGLLAAQLLPADPNLASPLLLRLDHTGNSCLAISPNAIEVDWLAGEIRVSVEAISWDFGLCVLEDSMRPPIEIQLGVPSRGGMYNVKVYNDNQDLEPGVFYDPDNLAGEIDFFVDAPNTLANPETPAEGSTQSGVGIVRGWACDAWKVEVQFNDGPRQRVAYGAERPDTAEVCGDTNNGYGFILSWGLLGNGSQRMKTFINNEEVSDVTFEVNGLDDPFLTDVSGEYELQDFPAPGQSVNVRWSEADQNFIIIDATQ